MIKTNKMAGKKGILSLLLISFIISGLYGSSPVKAATDSAYFSVDGELIKTNYFMQNGRVMVPDIFFKHTGATVDKNEKYNSIAVERNNIVAFPLEKTYMDYYVKEKNKWIREYLATTTTVINGRPYIPLLVTAQKLGMTVTYDFKINRTFIQTNTPVVNKSSAIEKGDTTEKRIALTFDDGPDKMITPQILDILKEKGVPATFFVVGEQVSYYPQLAKRMVEEGHTIANHTWDHPELSKLYTSQVIQQITSTNEIVEKITGVKANLFRPPYGDYTSADALVFDKLGFKNILWSVDTIDYSGKSAEEILTIVQRDKSPGGIILQHNFQSSKLQGTVDALPQMIDQLREEGYELVTIDRLLAK
ncbi:polysaccharide deacetylase family protein [Jeotgalibacillus campisalis]|uniref:Polysaccharide deacetylase n=1 Tax=Jeotgalibacillus campisalis TaxID=220754 RepID=A0A0C2VR04_9BACL|nr:polysaccharide deacetylase family protein [Jeotgalibacillus campisalis]KIL46413.1 polysaccharide deacetylase [Jeotgalibacillus campisalis]